MGETHQRGGRSRLGIAPLGAAALILLTGSGGSCSESQRAETTPPPAEVQEPALTAPDARLVVVTDLKGYLEPCGCTSRPLGGIDRLAARVRALRADGVPTLMLSAGDLFFDGGADHGSVGEDHAVTQEVWKAELVAEILRDLQLGAAGMGPLDLRFGATTFERLRNEASFPILAARANIARPASPDDEGEAPEPTPLPSHRVLEAGSLRVGVFGVLASRAEGLSVDADPLSAARAAVEALVAENADVVVALTHGHRRLARDVAAIDGVHLVVQGGLDQAEVLPPIEHRGRVLVHAGRQGMGLTVVDLVRRGEGHFTDASAWTRRVERERVLARAEELEARIEAWSSDDGVDPSDLARQRARLEGMQAEAAALLAPPSIAEGNVLVARHEELDPEAARDASVTERLTRHDRRVNEHNGRVLGDLRPDPAPEGSPHYVGSQACASCHGAAVRWWRGTSHGRAYATLETRHKNFNLSCVGCHVTGYFQPGGSGVTGPVHLRDVGCESCHGPGSAHIEANAGTDIVRDPPESLCRGCHNPEHSDTFHYPTYRRLMIAPGHGLPLAGAD